MRARTGFVVVCNFPEVVLCQPGVYKGYNHLPVSVFYFSIIILLFIIEVLQLVTRRESFDIDDFILNMLANLTEFGSYLIK